MPEPGNRPPSAANLTGIGGWLLLFAVGQFGVLAQRLLLISGSQQSVVAFHILMSLLAVAGLTLLFVRHRLAPAFWTAYQILFLLEVTFVHLPDSKEEFDAQFRANQASFILGIVWLVYWIRSQRVRSTFGSAGFAALRAKAPEN